MKVFLGADHRGFELKEKIKDFLSNSDLEVIDKGAFKYDKADDFVDFAKEVAEDVSYFPQTKGILFCGSGAGAEIAANKIKGVRAFVGFDIEQTKNARADDDPNVLAIATNFTDAKKAIEIVKTFLETPFDPAERHVRRLKKIEELER